jgi:hypothetical protein
VSKGFVAEKFSCAMVGPTQPRPLAASLVPVPSPLGMVEVSLHASGVIGNACSSKVKRASISCSLERVDEPIRCYATRDVCDLPRAGSRLSQTRMVYEE